MSFSLQESGIPFVHGGEDVKKLNGALQLFARLVE
jgi:hypothetical protein